MTRTPSSASRPTRRSSRRLCRPGAGTTSSSAGELEHEDDTKEVFFALAVEDIQRACDLLRPVWERTDGIDGLVSIEVDPELAYDRDGTFERGDAAPPAGRSPERLREDPGDRSRARRDRGLDRRRALDQRHAHLLARAPRRGRRGVRSRARAPRRGRVEIRGVDVGRELLRLARGHRGRPTAGGDRVGRIFRGGSRSPTRSSRTSTTSRSSPARAGSVLQSGSATTALPLGVHVDEEPRVPGRPLRRRADRAGHREHDADRDDRRFPGPRRRQAETLTEGSTRPVRCSTISPLRASTTTTSLRRSRARASRSSPSRSPRCSRASRRSAPSSRRREPRRPRAADGARSPLSGSSSPSGCRP